MKWAGWLLFVLLAWQAPALVAEADLLTSVSARLLTGEQLQGRFKQEKTLPFLTRPLVSSGDFSLTDHSGLRWRVSEPVLSEMTVTSAGVRLNGRVVADRGAGELIASLIQAFMTGDLAGLQRSFTVSGELTDDSWQLKLRPRTLMLKSALANIDIRGNRFLAHVAIYEASNAVTRIHFYDMTLAAKAALDRHADSP